MHRRMCEDLVSRHARFAVERTLVFPCGTLFGSISSGKGGRVWDTTTYCTMYECSSCLPGLQLLHCPVAPRLGLEGRVRYPSAGPRSKRLQRDGCSGTCHAAPPSGLLWWAAGPRCSTGSGCYVLLFSNPVKCHAQICTMRWEQNCTQETQTDAREDGLSRIA